MKWAVQVTYPTLASEVHPSVVNAKSFPFKDASDLFLGNDILFGDQASELFTAKDWAFLFKDKHISLKVGSSQQQSGWYVAIK